MPVQEFTFVLDRGPTDDEIDTIFEECAGEATPEYRRGDVLLHFDREADSLAEALASALRDTQRAGFTVTAVQSDDLVSMSDIASRTGRTYEAVRLLATGQRGPGGFPPAYQGGGVSLYSWTQVLDWLNEHFRKIAETTTHDREIAAADHLVRALRLLDKDNRETFAEKLLSAA